MNKKQSGFTLVELVIVVVILGILAVTAIPKFLDLTDQAQQASVEGMAGGFATGISLVRAQWEAEGRPQISAVNSVVYDGTALILTTEAAGIRPGYITGLSDGSLLDGSFADNCAEIWNNILQQPPKITTVAGDLNNDGIIYFAAANGSGTTASCSYYLRETLSQDANGAFIAPTAGDTSIGNNFTYLPATSAITININNVVN